MGCSGRFSFLLSIILMLVSCGFLMVGVQGTENETVKTVLETLFCEENEQATQELGQYEFSTTFETGGRSIRIYCEDTAGEGTPRDITMSAVGLFICGFAGPFIVSLLMSIFSINAMVRRKTQSFMGGLTSLAQQGGTVVDMRNRSGQQANIPPEALETIQQVFGKIGTTVQSTTPKQDLTERLKQLKEAYDEGLISRTEYDRVREALLDNFDDSANQ